MWLFVGFGTLGLLIGHLVGMSASEIAASVAGLLFAFGGGSAIAFMERLEVPARASALKAMTALALACLVGMYSGVLISEHRLLSPANGQSEASKDNKYLFGHVIGMAHGIDVLYTSGSLTAEEAYEKLYEYVDSLETEAE